jgi:signal peptidase
VTATVNLLPLPRWLLKLVLWLVMGIATGILMAIALPAALGYHPFTVMSGSMDPAIGTGDVVVDKRVSPRALHVGDVVTFRDPANSKRLITHRVRKLRFEGGQVRVVTKGDANNTVEQWSIPAHGTVGQVAYRIPLIGHVVVWTRGAAGRLGLVVIPALLLAGLLLTRIWRPEAEKAPRVEEASSR